MSHSLTAGSPATTASTWNHLRPSQPFPVPRNYRRGGATAWGMPAAAMEAVGAVTESRGGARLTARSALHPFSIRDYFRPSRPFPIPRKHRSGAATAGGMPDAAAMEAVGAVAESRGGAGLTARAVLHPASIWDHLRPSRPFPIPRNHRSGAVTGGMPDVAATESVGGVAESRGGAGLIAPAPGRAPTPHLHSASIRDHVQPFRPFLVPRTHRDGARRPGGCLSRP